MTHVLYNPLAGNGQGEHPAKELISRYTGREPELVDMTKIDDYASFFAGISPDDEIVLCGGDGTLNHFINDIEGVELKNEIFFYPVGTGNDFARDLGKQDDKNPFNITKYLSPLPLVYVNGKQYRFINGIGYGIDGYCCEEGDRQRAKSDKPVNYTAIAIKGLLFHYKPTNAKITVDGVTKTYEKVWLAPTMHGRFYGGGMIPTPGQDRLESKKLSVMVMYGSGKIKTLAVFPSIFKGEHVKHTEMVELMTGNDITVEFDRPTALQVDGETILGVTSYRAVSAAYAREKEPAEA